MKKVLFSCAFAIGLMATVSSCSREFTCECSVTDSSGFFDDVTTSSTITAKKSDAEAACNSSSTAGTLTTSCEIID